MDAKLDQNAGWDAIEATITRTILASPESFAPATVLNAGDFVRECRSRVAIPEGVAKGYWNTFRIWWTGIEVEIFDDRYEFYQFTEGDTRIAHFEHAPGAELPREFVNQLPQDVRLRTEAAG